MAGQHSCAMGSVLVAPLGDFYGETWREVTYKLRESPERSKISLSVVARHVRPSKIIVVVLDTLANRDDFKDYEELRDEIGGDCKDFLGKWGIPAERAKVIVAPGVGRFARRQRSFTLEVDGEMMDYFYYVLFELAKELVGLESDSEVCLDLTHGVNFMPVFTYRALDQLLGVLSFAKNIRFKVFNSEPVPPVGQEEVQIHEVENRVVYPRLSPVKVGFRGEASLLKVRKENEKLSKEITEFRVDEGELNAFLSAIVNGLPLALYRFCPSKDFGKEIGDAVKKWREKTTVEAGPGRLRIERKLRFTEDFMRCVRLWLASTSFGLERRDAATLEDLKGIGERLFEREGLKKALISRTLRDIEEGLKDKPSLREWKALREAIGKGGEFNPNNFLAHAGLEYNVTHVRYHDQELEFRYPDDEIPRVKGACSQGLFSPQRKAGPVGADDC